MEAWLRESFRPEFHLFLPNGAKGRVAKMDEEQDKDLLIEELKMRVDSLQDELDSVWTLIDEMRESDIAKWSEEKENREHILAVYERIERIEGMSQAFSRLARNPVKKFDA
jgi:hypothetical protein